MLTLCFAFALAQTSTLQKLEVRFHVDGDLYVSKPNILFPKPAFDNLYLIAPDKTQHKIKSFDDLRGKVHLRNSEDALQYVRLVGSPATAAVWGDPEYEVARRDIVKGDFVFGDTDTFRAVAFGIEGQYGAAKLPMIEADGFHLATVEKGSDAFVIRRWLLRRIDRKSITAERVEETVLTDGTYTRKSLEKETPKGAWLYVGFIDSMPIPPTFNPIAILHGERT